MPAHKKGPRVLGPYEKGDGRWQAVFIDPFQSDPEKRRADPTFPTREDAEDFIRETLASIAKLSNTTIGDAIRRHREHQLKRGHKGKPVKKRSATETERRLLVFFPCHDSTVGTLTADECAALYDLDAPDDPAERAKVVAAVRRQHKLPSAWVPFTWRLRPDGEPISVAYHRGALAEAKTFLDWCVEQKWLQSNPLSEVEGIGTRKRGKPQLRIDEARRFYWTGLDRAQAGDEGALAALMTLLMALSGTEITERKVRDLDDDGNILRVEDGKTDARNAPVEVPEELRPLLLRQAAGRDGNEYLFPAAKKGKPHWRDWPAECVRRICRLARVPEVCGHSMRGLHASIAYERGATGRLVSDGLRHADDSGAVSKTSYARPGAVRTGQQRRALLVLAGGKGQ